MGCASPRRAALPLTVGSTAPDGGAALRTRRGSESDTCEKRIRVSGSAHAAACVPHRCGGPQEAGASTQLHGTGRAAAAAPRTQPIWVVLPSRRGPPTAEAGGRAGGRAGGPQRPLQHIGNGMSLVWQPHDAVALPVTAAIRRWRRWRRWRQWRDSKDGDDGAGSVEAAVQEKGSWLLTIQMMLRLHRQMCRSAAAAGAPGIGTGAPVAGSSRQ